ncbi:MAG: hypothetical protein HKN42_15195 [Granulosicoccus sp.]|nr:hypothetical protein [Granulosicoccus sp.]
MEIDPVQFVDLIAVLAVIQFLSFSVLTGAARRSSGLKAPAITGHPLLSVTGLTE